ncbi:MAG: HDIG domain-containing protein [Treponema sp.]|jgi:putative nucleotidyltransferase with HDIG domain|nr:HDIG domain-containing protein [Treponema sp.]
MKKRRDKHPFKLPKLRRIPLLVTLVAFLATGAICVKVLYTTGATEDFRDFEVGRVAERDVITERQISYIDGEATRIRYENQVRRIPAVFKYDMEASTEMRDSYKRFAALSHTLFAQNVSEAEYLTALDAQFAGLDNTTLGLLFKAAERDEMLDIGYKILDQALEAGVFSLHKDGEAPLELPVVGQSPDGLERFSLEQVELLHNYGARTERERISYGHIITRVTLADAIDRYAASLYKESVFLLIATNLVGHFVQENVFFSPVDTEQRLIEANIQTEPVVKYIEPGTRIIKRGFIITESAMTELQALKPALSGRDVRVIIGQTLILLFLYVLFIFLGSIKIIGRPLTDAEIYLLSALAALYLIGAVLTKNLSFNTDYFPVSIVLPTALVVMLPAILIAAPFALVMALALPLSAFLSGSFDVWAYFFALVSGIVASYLLRGAEKRMDLVRAGLIIAAVQAVAAVAILLIQKAALAWYPTVLFWAAFNGIASGMLVLGLLPMLEHALDAVTTFRLIEMSDLNSPTLKLLFTKAPGTYSHSLMVANLAESACREIGANPLLARVGAYHHDIGKMEQPEYFVENQTNYNKHKDLPPRLSATVIRSHVKLGVEKARELSLPRVVIDIIAEHHGNSVISWFYNEALKQDPQVSVEDFSYPGNPPRSRESAVVMLADMAEAACRTLEKPTAAKLEKFIQELFTGKVEHGQLAESELTFRDLETIKKAFVRVLAGHYHSRIEYPKLPPKEPPAKIMHIKEAVSESG